MKEQMRGKLVSLEEQKQLWEKAGIEPLYPDAIVVDYRKKNRKGAKDEKGKSGEFIRGPIPIDWLIKVADISSGAFHLGVILWHLERMRGAPVVMTHARYKRYGLPQKTVHRLLRAMAAGGLITLELDIRRSARVTVIKEPQQPRQPLETVQ